MGATPSKPPPQITVGGRDCGIADADVPIVPPVFLLILLAIAFLLARFVDPFTFLPDSIKPLKVRLALFTIVFGSSIYGHMQAMDALHGAGSGIAFTPTASVATSGPYAYTRNPFYCLLIFVQVPAIALVWDCGWIIVAIAPMFAWLSKVVIPGEEAFLLRNFGAEYEAFLASTPQWLIS